MDDKKNVTYKVILVLLTTIILIYIINGVVLKNDSFMRDMINSIIIISAAISLYKYAQFSLHSHFAQYVVIFFVLYVYLNVLKHIHR
jgi:hypothetical protein